MDILVPKVFVGTVAETTRASRAIVKAFVAGKPLVECAGELVSLKATGHFVAMDINGGHPLVEVAHVHVATLEAAAMNELLSDRARIPEGRAQLARLWDALSQEPWGRLCISAESAKGTLTHKARAVRYLEVALAYWDELNGLGDVFLGLLHHLGPATAGSPFVIAASGLRVALFVLGVPLREINEAGADADWFRNRARACVDAFHASRG